MATEISVFNSDEFEELVSQHDLRISKALVETILLNLKGRKKHLHALTVIIEQEQTIYDITVDRADFQKTLESNLPIYEKHELYEQCAEIVKAIKFLESELKTLLPPVRRKESKTITFSSSSLKAYYNQDSHWFGMSLPNGN